MLSITPDIGHKKRDRGSRRAWTDHGSEGLGLRGTAGPALLEPPIADAGVVPRAEHLRHLVAAPGERARVVRVLRSPLERLAERLLYGALLVPERTRKLPHHRVHDHHRGE